MTDFINSNVAVSNPDADGNYAWCRIKAGGSGDNKSTFNEVLVKTLRVTNNIRTPVHFLLKQPINASSTAVTAVAPGVAIVFPSANNYSKIVTEDYGGHTLVEPINNILGFRIPSQVGANVTIPDLLIKCNLKVHSADPGANSVSMLLNSLTAGAGAVPAHQEVATLAFAGGAAVDFELNTEIVLPSFVTPSPAVDIDYTLNLLLSGGPGANMEATGVLEITTF